MAAFGTTASTTFVELAKSREASSMVTLMAKEDKEQRAQFRSKSMAWKEPMLLIQRMSSGKARKTRSFQQKDGAELHHSRRPANSKWARFWKKLRLNGVGKRVHAARPDWLDYDAQSYSMNFENDTEAQFAISKQMPKVSGPGAREIVTVLLQRTPSTNRNSGSILVPRPVLDVKPENAPLWKRRSIQAPSSLDIKLKHPSIKRRMSVGA